MRTYLQILTLSLALLCAGAWGADWYVGTTADLTNAVASAASNDTVWVSNGVYVVNLTVGGGVTVRSKTGLPAGVILDGGYPVVTNRVVVLAASSQLIGLTIKNGYETSAFSGGGIYFPGPPTPGGIVSNCIITGNTADHEGGGARNVVLYNCDVIGNRAHTEAGGLSFGKAYNCNIISNVSDYEGGGTCESVLLYNCLLIGNVSHTIGGGAECNGTAPTILYNCSLINNVASNGGGGIYGMADSAILYNCISWGNNKEDEGISFVANSCGVGNFYTNSLFGNTTNDPIFASETDYHLQAGSPCRDTGTNFSWMTDITDARSRDIAGNQRVWPQGGTVDMGAYEYYPPIVLILGGTGLSNMGGTGLETLRGYITGP